MSDPPDRVSAQNFPLCPRCPYVQSGTPGLCHTCFAAQLEDPGACGVCSQRLDTSGQCPNRLCGRSDRHISRIHAVGMRSKNLRWAITRYKYTGHWGWAIIFGRVIMGWLEAHAAPETWDVICAAPSWAGPGAKRDFLHTELVLEHAASQGELTWPIEPGLLFRTAEGPQSAGSSYWEKMEAAEALRDIVRVTSPDRIADARVLIYDDLCVTGQSLDVLADLLHTTYGAASVEALVLAREPWRF